MKRAVASTAPAAAESTAQLSGCSPAAAGRFPRERLLQNRPAQHFYSLSDTRATPYRRCLLLQIVGAAQQRYGIMAGCGAVGSAASTC